MIPRDRLRLVPVLFCAAVLFCGAARAAGPDKGIVTAGTADQGGTAGPADGAGTTGPADETGTTGSADGTGAARPVDGPRTAGPTDGTGTAGPADAAQAAGATGSGQLAAPADGFKIATWNMEWLTRRTEGLPDDALPKRDDDIRTLAGYARHLDADVVAMEEVGDLDVVARIFPPDRYRLFITGDDVVQKVALAVRRGIDVRRNPDLTALDVAATARYRLRSGLDVTLTLAGATLRILAVHLKSGCFEGPLGADRDSCRKLSAQLPVLQTWIRDRVRDRVPFALLGDFNRHLPPDDALLGGLVAAAPLRVATEGHASPCWGGEDFIDQILLGGRAGGWMVPSSLRVLVYAETAPEMKERLSDHCPVSIRLRPDN